jgi:hypothetical protein
VGGSVIIGLLAGGLVALSVARPGPPPPPADLTATARTCVPPQCGAIGSTVTLGWAPVTDPGVEGLSVIRDGRALANASLPPDATGFVDDDVAPGTSHAYQVVTTGPGGNGRSDTATATAPLPPLSAAQLRGIFDVAITVRRVDNLASVAGIRHPRPGDSATTTWGFRATCPPQAGACPARWSGRTGLVRPNGAAWSGRLLGPAARCPDGASTASPIDLRLHASDAAIVDGVWSVASFTGGYAVSFHCPGFLVSRGTVTVSGHAR